MDVRVNTVMRFPEGRVGMDKLGYTRRGIRWNLNDFLMNSIAWQIRLFLRRPYRRLSLARRQFRTACGMLARAARLAMSAWIPLRKEFLILPSAIYVPGLFSEFAAVLGLLEHYEYWKARYSGIRVDFTDQGLYYDPATGQNWWSYFFEPIDIGTVGTAQARTISTDEHFHFARRTERQMSRKTGFELIGSYVRIRPHLREKVAAYVRTNFDNFFVIGIHYRGTDKVQDAPRVAYETVYAAVRETIRCEKTGRYKLFLATDEQAFLNYMLNLFPDTLHYLKTFRSLDGTPIDVRTGDNHRKGEDAILDCLLLSECHCLIRTASNLGLCSSFFNPDMPVMLLNRER